MRGTITVPGSSSCIALNPGLVRFLFHVSIFVVYLFRTSRDVTRAVIPLLIITTVKNPTSWPANKASSDPAAGFSQHILSQMMGKWKGPVHLCRL